MAAEFESLRNDSVRLRAFIREMPKGGDLHNHLGGAVYAENLLRWAGEDRLCVVTATLSLVPPPCDPARGSRPAAGIAQGSPFERQVIDAWSMRDFKPGRETGHDHFFATFGKFSLATDHHVGDMIAEARVRAATDNVSYLELMQTLDGTMAAALGTRVGFSVDFASMRTKLIAAGLRDSLPRVRASLDSAEAKARALLRCNADASAPGCGVTVRYLYQVLRGLPPQVVFAQILTGFELAKLDPRVVGFNLVMPEDGAVSMQDFHLHMTMIAALRKEYPGVHITLHAGELTDKLVSASGLRSHIRESVELAHAERIGHGVDVLHEDGADDLLREMARDDVLVEIALTSNDVILGVRDGEHPLASYLKYGVPVALATDDEGVSRSGMTQEYLRAVTDQHLGYRTLRTMARNSIACSFAEPALKARLLREFDDALEEFEARWALLAR